MFLFSPLVVHADISQDNLNSTNIEDTGEEKDFETLMSEARMLILNQHPIDARAKLQKALALRPDDYRPYLLLGQYYLSEVGHFKLAYRYILSAEEHFYQKYGIGDGDVISSQSKEEANILYLKSEAELNLDKYSDSLITLDRFGKKYFADWLPGSRAWVLMKLRRLDEAIKVAQTGLLYANDPKRTYNILGILFSMNDNRELSLNAFAQAIANEMQLGSMGQAATPLNNAGEVYREIYQDNLAEASWLKALQLQDGCDHILPSLNLSILYTDQLRLFLADRTLSDFQACYAQHQEREDTEHRSLLALARGKIALRKGEFKTAIESTKQAIDKQQWFGKIGTNENDVKFAATIALAQSNNAYANELSDTITDSFSEYFLNLVSIRIHRINSWWYFRQARNQAIAEMSDFEDLKIRNTDTMLEYPTLGEVIKDFPRESLLQRLDRLRQSDNRAGSKVYYNLYYAQNLVDKGKYSEAISILSNTLNNLRPIDRLLKAELLAHLIKAKANIKYFWQSFSKEESNEILRLKLELFQLSPPFLRYYNFRLPVSIADNKLSKLEQRIKYKLENRFEFVKQADSPYRLEIKTEGETSKGIIINITLSSIDKGQLISESQGEIINNNEGFADTINKFIASTFKHKVDPASEPIPKLEFLNGLI